MKYKYRPKTKGELVKAIKKEIFEVQGTSDNPNWNANLNCIDTSNITDMSFLFAEGGKRVEYYGLGKFNGDISKWDVSNVKDMSYMFTNSQFNGNISEWDVSSVEIMSGMFHNSIFNGDISKWDVGNVKNMSHMFIYSKFNGDISKWDVSNVKEMEGMFANSQFNGDIGDWNTNDEKRKETELNNISAGEDSDIVPDKVVSLNTLKRIIDRGLVYKALPNIEQNLFLEADKEEIPDEMFVINNKLRERYKELAKKILNKYLNVSFDKKELNKILGKNSDLLDKSYEERISGIYEKYKNKEERKKALAAAVMIPYTKENKLQLKKEFGKKDNNEIQIPS